ncbi:hypothetical protein, partial [Streptomyces sp. NPDC002573]|uniref:hypothetical protein n=1 Tax=Streptomyces sp. NPDC002573 TaxID=3364651 RepID=UPI0036CC76EE
MPDAASAVSAAMIAVSSESLTETSHQRCFCGRSGSLKGALASIRQRSRLPDEVDGSPCLSRVIAGGAFACR